jgi:hypothetical protein
VASLDLKQDPVLKEKKKEEERKNHNAVSMK